MSIINEISTICAITFVIVYIIDFSGFTTELNRFIYRMRGKVYNYQPLMKPFGCSVCMTFWIISIIMLQTHSLTFSLLAGVLSALFTNIYRKIIMFYNKITL